MENLKERLAQAADTSGTATPPPSVSSSSAKQDKAPAAVTNTSSMLTSQQPQVTYVFTGKNGTGTERGPVTTTQFSWGGSPYAVTATLTENQTPVLVSFVVSSIPSNAPVGVDLATATIPFPKVTQPSSNSTAQSTVTSDATPTATGTVVNGNGSKGGLKAGAIAGIVIGVLVIIAFLVGFFLFRRRQRQKKSSALLPVAGASYTDSKSPEATVTAVAAAAAPLVAAAARKARKPQNDSAIEGEFKGLVLKVEDFVTNFCDVPVYSSNFPSGIDREIPLFEDFILDPDRKVDMIRAHVGLRLFQAYESGVYLPSTYFGAVSAQRSGTETTKHFQDWRNDRVDDAIAADDAHPEHRERAIERKAREQASKILSELGRYLQMSPGKSDDALKSLTAICTEFGRFCWTIEQERAAYKMEMGSPLGDKFNPITMENSRQLRNVSQLEGKEITAMLFPLLKKSGNHMGTEYENTQILNKAVVLV